MSERKHRYESKLIISLLSKFCSNRILVAHYSKEEKEKLRLSYIPYRKGG